MNSNHLEALESSLQKTHEWIRDMSVELGDKDRHHAYAALRATLHTLRDRLTPEQSAHLAAQLPLVLRGLFFEGWSPARVPLRIRSREEYVESVHTALSDAAPELRERFEQVTEAGFRVLAKHVDHSEVQKIHDSLPKPLRSLWPQQL